jgi:alpha-amylase
VPNLEKMIRLRKSYAYGEQRDYFEDSHVIGWSRLGDKKHKNSGMAVVMSNAGDGCRHMYVGESFAGEKFYDVTGGCTDPVTIGDDGSCDFYVRGGHVSVWVCTGAFEDIQING